MAFDRAAAVRSALRRLVAERGFHGVSMSAVAKEAGVATGTAYVHYDSKDELVKASYRELKAGFVEAGAAAIDPDGSAECRFRQLWLGAYHHLSCDPVGARFMIQVDASPYAAELYGESAAEPPTRAVTEEGAAADPLMIQAGLADMSAALLDLPLEVIYDLGIGPMVRVVASERPLTAEQLDTMAGACWRAISKPTRR
ncbi:MAG: TetR/AcrR family transcriptional regulator [Acidimicrobiales bacterium]